MPLNTPNTAGEVLIDIHFGGVLMQPALATTHMVPLVNPPGTTKVTAAVDVVVCGEGLPSMVEPAGPVHV